MNKIMIAVISIVSSSFVVEFERDISIFFEAPIRYDYEVTLINELKQNHSKDKMLKLLNSKNWIDSYVYKDNFLGKKRIFIKQLIPIFVWNDRFFIDSHQKKFIISNDEHDFPLVFCPEEKIQDLLIFLGDLDKTFKKFGIGIDRISFEYGGGWRIKLENHQIVRISEEIDTNLYKKLTILFDYMFENNLNPSIIDMRNRSGAALTYAK